MKPFSWLTTRLGSPEPPGGRALSPLSLAPAGKAPWVLGVSGAGQRSLPHLLPPGGSLVTGRRQANYIPGMGGRRDWWASLYPLPRRLLR